MVFKPASFFFLVLTVTQVIASTLQLRSLQLRSLETLGSRQDDTCPICTTVADNAGICGTPACVCTTAFAADVQSCVNCALATNPTPEVIAAVQELVGVYASTCSGVAGVPAITTPAGTPGTSVGTSVGTSTTRRTTTPLTSTRTPQTVTSVTNTPVVQSTVGSNTTPTGGSVPPVVSQSGSGDKGRQASFAAIGALVGAALVL